MYNKWGIRNLRRRVYPKLFKKLGTVDTKLVLNKRS